MAQIAEYSLVVLVSTLFVGASVATYDAYARFESASEAGASFSALLDLASQAIENGSARATILLPPSMISCNGGVFSVSSRGSVLNQTIPVDCNFTVEATSGFHTVRFYDVSSTLSLQVS